MSSREKKKSWFTQSRKGTKALRIDHFAVDPELLDAIVTPPNPAEVPRTPGHRLICPVKLPRTAIRVTQHHCIFCLRGTAPSLERKFKANLIVKIVIFSFHYFDIRFRIIREQCPFSNFFKLKFIRDQRGSYPNQYERKKRQDR
jgi:hypothetical protein